MYLNYKSISQLNRDIVEWLPNLPQDIDAVVGIPRSGLLVANLIALYRNIPMADIDSFLAGTFMKGGERLAFDSSNISKVLIVDDSLCGGRAMQQARQKVAESGVRIECIYAAVYIVPDSSRAVDFFHEVLPIPRIFEWNMFHHGLLKHACMDIDGVLCPDPTPEENDDGLAYKRFLLTAPMRFRPTVKVGWLVTARLEKYRNQTRQWLEKNRIEYGELLMLDLPNKQARIKSQAHASFKAEMYLRTNAKLFIESSESQAHEISRLSGRQVICVDKSEAVSAGVYSAVVQNNINRFKKFKGLCKETFRLMLRCVS